MDELIEHTREEDEHAHRENGAKTVSEPIRHTARRG